MCQRRKFNKKGFTLIELIVVIAIIGVLSAILVPSYFKYVEQAKLTADKSDVKNMNTILKAFMAEYGEDNYEAPEIIHIINSAEKNYSFRTRLANYSFWYNKETKEVELLDNNAVNTELQNYNSKQKLLNTNSVEVSLEEIIPGRILLSHNGVLGETLSKIRNMRNPSDFGTCANLNPESSNCYEKGYARILIEKGVSFSHIQKFDPINTLYVNSYGGFTSATLSDQQQENAKAPYVDNVVFASGIQSIPKLFNKKIGIGMLDSQGLLVATFNIRIPITVKVAEKGSLINIVSDSELVGSNIHQIQFEEGALSNNLKNVNSFIREVKFEYLANEHISVKVYNGNSQELMGSYGIPEITLQDPIPTINLEELGVLEKNDRVRIDFSNLNNTNILISNIEYLTITDNYGEDVYLTDTIKIFGQNGIVGYFRVAYIKKSN